MYDAIVVGGRCAGSATAMLLARLGRRVLLLDRDELPSDKGLSTHLVWQTGAERLRAWGLLEALRATNCPAQSEMVLDLGEMALRGEPRLREGVTPHAYAPRRAVLDGLLLDAAKEAGVEVRDRCSAEDLVRDGERVVGIHFQDDERGPEEVRARLVIGADGLDSTIAKLVGAIEYNAQPKVQRTYFGYFEDVPLPTIEFYSRPGRMAFAWKTNDDVVVAGFCCRLADRDALRGGTDAVFEREMAACAPDLARRLAGGRRSTPIRWGSVRSFMRTASGPGWALVGDAGLSSDPIAAAGISHALIQAEMLAEAVDDGLSTGLLNEALTRFGEARDAELGPLYGFACEMAKLDPTPNEELTHLFVGMAAKQADFEAYLGVFAQTVPVAEFFDPANYGRIVEQGRSAMLANAS